MSCGRGCTPHRPLVNRDNDGTHSGPMPAATPADVPQAARPLGQESRPNGRWRYGTTRQLTDVVETYDGARTEVPRVNHVQVEQMDGVIPTPATGVRRTAVRDTGGGDCG